MRITADQVRAARALLRLEQSDLARRAKVSVSTVRRLESATGLETVAPVTMAGIQAALEEAGVEFIANGVRRRSPPRADAEERIRRVREITAKAAPLFTHDFTEADLYDERGLPT